MRCARRARGVTYQLPADMRSDRVTASDIALAMLMLALAYGWLLFGLALS